MEPDWGMWAGTSIHDAILVVTDHRDRVAPVAEQIATGGHFVLVCRPTAVPQVLALAHFEVVVILDDVSTVMRQAAIDTVRALPRTPCEVVDDMLVRFELPGTTDSADHDDDLFHDRAA